MMHNQHPNSWPVAMPAENTVTFLISAATAGSHLRFSTRNHGANSLALDSPALWRNLVGNP